MFTHIFCCAVLVVALTCGVINKAPAPAISLSTTHYSILVVDPDYPKPSSVQKKTYPWDAVYAPHRKHDVSFVGGTTKGKSIVWTISKQVTSDEGKVSYEKVISWSGSVYEKDVILATVAGCNHLVSAVDDFGNTATHTFISKHIRREVRSLSDADRELFLTSVATVMGTPTKKGRALYGDDFLGGEW
jgi:hypothetical protein